jgi:hypothetical protein
VSVFGEGGVRQGLPGGWEGIDGSLGGGGGGGGVSVFYGVTRREGVDVKVSYGSQKAGMGEDGSGLRVSCVC